VIDFSFGIKGRAIAGASFAAATAIFGAQPVLASSSNAADIAAPLRAAQEARQNSQASGDDEFRNLFSSWRTLDRTSAYVASSSSIPSPAFGLVPVRQPASIGGIFSGSVSGRVSIPSRSPIEGFRLTSGFGMRYHPILGRRRAHKGVDLAAPIGTPVYASADATVGMAQWFSSYGLYVQLEHGADIQTRYGHMSRLNVYAGQHVHKGDLIGFVGTTGRSTGPHLHYEVRIAGVSVNPIPYLQSGEFHRAPEVAPEANVGLVAVSARRR
jgi:murein DD-endopeptidase MepM/ murein hydrolase activator NlpD